MTLNKAELVRIDQDIALCRQRKFEVDVQLVLLIKQKTILLGHKPTGDFQWKLGKDNHQEYIIWSSLSVSQIRSHLRDALPWEALEMPEQALTPYGPYHFILRDEKYRDFLEAVLHHMEHFPDHYWHQIRG